MLPIKGNAEELKLIRETKEREEDELFDMIRTKSKLPVKASSFIIRKMGSISDNYRVLQVIGRGSFSEVAKVEHCPTGQIRAVKKINKILLNIEQLDSLMNLREANVLIELDHPNILRLYEIYEDIRSFYLVTEFCDGGELYDTIMQ